jgi:hypothetical protein
MPTYKVLGWLASEYIRRIRGKQKVMKQNGTQIMVYAGEFNVFGERVNTTKTDVKVKSLYRCNRHVAHIQA